MKTIHTLCLTICALVWLGLRPAVAQLIIPDVSIDLRQIPLEAQARQDSTNLDSLLTLYLGDQRRDWNRDDNQYDLPILINIYFTDYSANPQEDKYKANLIITNRAEARFDDKRWEFGLRHPFNFESGSYSAMTSVLEFYIWMLIGIEEDKFEKLGGRSFFDKARQVTLESSQSIYYLGWDKRSDLLREYTSTENEPFRELNFFYYTGIFYDEERDYENSEIYLRYAITKLDKIPIEKREQFLESNRADFAAAIGRAAQDRGEQAATRAREGLEALIRLDPSNNEVYESHMPVVEEGE